MYLVKVVADWTDAAARGLRADQLLGCTLVARETLDSMQLGNLTGVRPFLVEVAPRALARVPRSRALGVELFLDAVPVVVAPGADEPLDAGRRGVVPLEAHVAATGTSRPVADLATDVVSPRDAFVVVLFAEDEAACVADPGTLGGGVAVLADLSAREAVGQQSDREAFPADALLGSRLTEGADFVLAACRVVGFEVARNDGGRSG